MKADIHPTWFVNAKVTCACGNTFETGSTQEMIRVEICASCHPFFTGQQKLVDTLGQVERFERKKKVSEEKAEKRKVVVEARSQRQEKTKSDKPSLKDLLLQARKNINS